MSEAAHPVLPEAPARERVAAAGVATAAAAAWALPPLSERDFRGFQQLVYREAGIHLAPVKRALVVARLSRRLRELGLPSFQDYLARVQEDEAERVVMLDHVSTNETRFFREPQHFRFLEEVLVPRWRAAGGGHQGGKRVRVWSAACSSGEEPYTLAMVLHAALPAAEGWSVEVLATDLSTRVLARAREGVWPLARMQEVPQHHLKAHWMKGTGPAEGLAKASPALRQAVRFERLNLARPPHATHPAVGTRPFDVIFCRNVLIYFDAASKAAAVDGLLDCLAPGGHFLVGHSESLNGVTPRVRAVVPTVYRLQAG